MNENVNFNEQHQSDSTQHDVASDALLRLAQAAGLSSEWIDAFGELQHVSHQTLRAVLSALDLACDSDAACEASIAQLAQEEIQLALPPLMTAQVGREIVFSAHAKVQGLPYRLVFEQGEEVSGYLSNDADAPARLPAVDRIGYHRLYIGEVATLTLAVAPLRCFSVADAVGGNGSEDQTPHLWALSAQLYSLSRSDDGSIGDAGLGDFSALNTLAKSAAKHGASAIAISPVHAMFSANPDQYSPYGPSSRLFFNVLHIDPAAISGEEALAAAIERLGTEPERLALRANEFIDWPASARWRLAVLRDLFDHYDMRADSWKDFEAFRVQGGIALEDHARFEVLHEYMRADGVVGSWHTWPEQYLDPRGDAVAAFAQAHDPHIMFHAFLQWQAASGLQQAQQSARNAGMAIGLITDLAVGAEGGGSQAWSHQHQMLHGLSVGAPPDVLGPLGQSWGLSAFSPRALRQYGYQAYIEMLRAAFRYAGGVRIDHILGLARMWLVPDGSDGQHGAYLRYPFDDLIRLIALESHRHKAIVIGEDLGTVPAGFEDALAQAGLMGIRVLWFERDGNSFKPADRWSRQAIATTDTHDLPTVAGWWHASDIRWRNQLGLMGPGINLEQEYASRAHERRQLAERLNASGADPQVEAENTEAPLTQILKFIGSTPAPLVILPMEDVLLLEEQPNLPGTIDSHPNWRRRLPQHVENILDSDEIVERLAILKRARANVRP